MPIPTDKQADQRIDIVGGVDTHKDMHMAAVITTDGVVLGTEAFSTTRAGYPAMLHWMRSHGEVLRVGVEQTGSFGATLRRMREWFQRNF